jgi:hypothetical protein
MISLRNTSGNSSARPAASKRAAAFQEDDEHGLANSSAAGKDVCWR